MVEVLVVLACTMDKGCTETSTAYYNANDSLQQLVRRQEKLISDELPPIVVQYVAPYAVYTLGYKSIFKVTRNLSIGVGKYERNFLYTTTF